LLVCGFSSIPEEMALLLCLLEMASGILFVENLTVIQIPIEQIVEVSY
jgi:hypothetical protein